MKTSHSVLVAAGLVLGTVACSSTSTSTAAPSAATQLAARQAEVSAKGAQVMPFDLAATLHTFTKTDQGGVMNVTIRSDQDTKNVSLIREHLMAEATKFSAGSFDDPTGIHGADMPGLAALKTGVAQITSTYSELSNGAQITFVTTKPELVTALHSWFDAQLMDHGSDAMAGHQITPSSSATTIAATGTTTANASPAMGTMGSMVSVTSEFDFLTQMIPHHEEAVASAKVIVERSGRPAMVALGNAIIEAQNRELTQMREWLAAWYPGRDTTVKYTPMMSPLDKLSGDELDKKFLSEMVPHHGMAVMMSTSLLNQNLSKHDETATLARTIRESQRAEIMQMSAWLQDWFQIDIMSTMMGSTSGQNSMGGMNGMAGHGSMSGMDHTATTTP
jgi:uncharacterized protein (DUF305 family)